MLNAYDPVAELNIIISEFEHIWSRTTNSIHPEAPYFLSMPKDRFLEICQELIRKITVLHEHVPKECFRNLETPRDFLRYAITHVDALEKNSNAVDGVLIRKRVNNNFVAIPVCLKSVQLILEKSVCA